MNMGFMESNPLVEALDAVTLAEPRKPPRGYLGASQIGNECSRALWYSFRWCLDPEFDALSLRRFEDGFVSEDITAERLRKIPGVTLHTHQPNGEQFGFDDIGGHLSGHMDGAIIGIPQAPKTWHVWEHKASEEKTYNKLTKAIETKGEKSALAEWNETYYAQGQLYMHWTGMSRHVLTSASAGSRRYQVVRTDYNADAAKKYLEKARIIIEATEPPARLSDDPTFYKCGPKWCGYHDICHGTKIPQANCRTCVHATPETDGPGARWSCARHDIKSISYELQRKGCAEHLMIPPLIQFARAVNSQPDRIFYECEQGSFTNGNGEHDFSSVELFHAGGPGMIFDGLLTELREKMGARVVG